MKNDLPSAHDMPFKIFQNFWLIFLERLFIDKQRYENYAITNTIQEGSKIGACKVSCIIQR
jgi:hypothetical protein